MSLVGRQAIRWEPCSQSHSLIAHTSTYEQTVTVKVKRVCSEIRSYRDFTQLALLILDPLISIMTLTVWPSSCFSRCLIFLLCEAWSYLPARFLVFCLTVLTHFAWQLIIYFSSHQSRSPNSHLHKCHLAFALPERKRAGQYLRKGAVPVCIPPQENKQGFIWLM